MYINYAKNWLHDIFTDAYNMLLSNELTIQFSEVQMAKKYTQKLLTVFNHGRNDNQTFETPHSRHLSSAKMAVLKKANNRRLSRTVGCGESCAPLAGTDISPTAMK